MQSFNSFTTENEVQKEMLPVRWRPLITISNTLREISRVNQTQCQTKFTGKIYKGPITFRGAVFIDVR